LRGKTNESLVNNAENLYPGACGEGKHKNQAYYGIHGNGFRSLPSTTERSKFPEHGMILGVNKFGTVERPRL
jgi:hypothetical protein